MCVCVGCCCPPYERFKTSVCVRVCFGFALCIGIFTNSCFFSPQDYPTPAQIGAALTAENIFPIFVVPVNLEVTHLLQLYDRPYSLADHYASFLKDEGVQGSVVGANVPTIDLLSNIPVRVEAAISNSNTKTRNKGRP